MSHLSVYACRHVIQYTKQCFYSQDMWQDCEQASFTVQAQQCVIASLRTLFDPQEDSGKPITILGVGGGRCGDWCGILPTENSGNLIHFHEVDGKLYSQAKKTLLAGVGVVIMQVLLVQML